MKKLLIVLAGVSFLFTGCAYLSSENSKFKKALYYSDTNRNSKAVELYSEIIKANPKNFAAYSNRGLAYEKLAAQDFKSRKKYIDLAEKDYLSALSIRRDVAEVYNNLGALYINKKRFYDAVIYLNVAVDLAPRYYSALVNRGIANYNSGRGVEAYNDFYAAIKLQPETYLAYFNRGLYYYDVGDYLNAAIDQTYAIKYNPTFQRAYLERGRALKMYDAYADAMDDFRVAVSLDPKDAVAHYYYAEMLFKNHQYEDSISHLLIAKQENPKFVPAYELMGDILSVEDPMAAVQNYIVCKKLDPASKSRYDYKIRRVITDDGRKQIAASRFF
ncbi:tetratricopeptide (TPR) repeat protein [Elusimicrobium posterum]|uniref:tetratricopeptide repeat protein n=1 Tax=Elusimicrobium posterum TaxID=3116653 RepID=UPI003C7237FC